MYKRYLFLLILSFLVGCDRPYLAVVRRQFISEFYCPGNSRTLVINEKPRWSKEPLRHQGILTIPTVEKPGELCFDEECHPVFLSSEGGEYFAVFSEVVLPEWARIEFICPETGKVLYDSGEVDMEKGFCRQGKLDLFFFEGHARKKPGDSCCPEGVVCPSY
jgi:hypothetical protein